MTTSTGSSSEAPLSPQATDTVTPRKMAPTRRSERIVVIDILRGLAIFGILMVNMHYFIHPWEVSPTQVASTPVDQAAVWMINAFFTGKFFPVFSFLFGLGMAIQMERAAARDAKFAPLYARRLGLLLLFGLAHGILLWVGDILTLYALLGFVMLLLFRKAKPRTLWIWAWILIGLVALFILFSVGSIQFAMSIPDVAPEMEAVFAEQAAASAERVEEAYTAYGTGDYFTVTAQRVQDFIAFNLGATPFTAPTVFAMFLIGLAMGKAGRFRDIEGNIPFWRRTLLWTLPLGLVMNLVFASTNPSFVVVEPLGWDFALAFILNTIGGPLLALGYISGVVLLVHHLQPAERLLGLFAPVGRMALTNYLMHSIIWTTVFYGYGFGLFGQVGPAVGVLLTLLTIAIQIPLSQWWLNRYRFGPFEWLWRSLTYMRFQPMRKQPQPETA